jgi:hypothetical protein
VACCGSMTSVSVGRLVMAAHYTKFGFGGAGFRLGNASLQRLEEFN